MPTTAQRNKYEQRLAWAAEALYWSSQQAALVGDEGAEEDLMSMRSHVFAMLEESAVGRRRVRPEIPGQTRIPS